MKDDLVYIRHILGCIEKIERYARSGKEGFFADSMVTDAVVRKLRTQCGRDR